MLELFPGTSIINAGRVLAFDRYSFKVQDKKADQQERRIIYQPDRCRQSQPDDGANHRHPAIDRHLALHTLDACRDKDLGQKPTRHPQRCHQAGEQIRIGQLAHEPGEYQGRIDQSLGKPKDRAIKEP